MELNSFENMKELVIECYNKLKVLIKQNKTKDETLSKLVDEIDLYRKDFAFTAYKPLVTGLISVRESFRKELADTFTYEYDSEKISKHVKLMTGEFSDYLEQNDIDPEAEIIIEEELPLAKLTEDVLDPDLCDETAEAALEEVETEEAGEFEDMESVRELLTTFTVNIAELVTAADRKDKIVRDLINNAGRTDGFLKNNLLRPFKIRLRQFYEYIGSMGAAAETVENYREFLEAVIEKSADILTETGVTIEGATLDGAFDPKKHRVLKLIPADERAQEGHIAKRYSDCYIAGGKVIYPAKADVYK